MRDITSALEYSKMSTIPRDTSRAAHHAPPNSFAPPLARELLLFLLVSAFVVIPCFWHAHIEAGDLGSHVYNAWLAQLIEQGKAPGLHTVTQWNNILFDLLLLNFANLFGLAAAEKLATSLCVLLFFWGVFALTSAVSHPLRGAGSQPASASASAPLLSQSPWFLTPLTAMLSYGYIFHMGFLNYYLSLGLACLGLTLVWPARRNGLIAAALLAPVALLAHPLGFLLLLCAGSYRLLWLKWRGPSKWILPLIPVGICYATRRYVTRFPDYQIEWGTAPLWRLNGIGQLHVFGERYSYITIAAGIAVAVTVLFAMFRSGSVSKFFKQRQLIIEFYLISWLATKLLPENLQTDPTGGWIGALTTRLTLVTAIFGLCFLATLPLRSCHLATYAAIAALFFTFLYQDTTFLNCMEANTRGIAETLPFGTRVAASLFAPPNYRTVYLHVADRACVGHCFLISNYEPSTKQFRIRVDAGSPVVTASVDDSDDMQSGNYDVQDEDLPLKQIYQCNDHDLTQICIRDLSEDEKNGRLGYRPSR
jgi:hypothetical protein